MKHIFNKKIVSLVFTKVGIADTGLFAMKYEQLGSYNWTRCNAFFATGQAKKADRVTLFLTANRGLFKSAGLVTNFGTPILASYGYFFNDSQIKCAEEILNQVGIMKLSDKTE